MGRYQQKAWRDGYGHGVNGKFEEPRYYKGREATLFTEGRDAGLGKSTKDAKTTSESSWAGVKLGLGMAALGALPILIEKAPLLMEKASKVWRQFRESSNKSRKAVRKIKVKSRSRRSFS